MGLNYRQWCEERGVSHAHCPYDCEHPQPFVAPNGKLYCGRCWVAAEMITEMVPCGPGCDVTDPPAAPSALAPGSSG